MKKKIAIIVLSCALAAGALSGCSGNGANSSDSKTVTVKKDYNVDDYVKLGEYKGIEVTYDLQTVTDEEVDAQIQSNLESAVTYSDVDRTTVQNGDKVNIDYEGFIDGESRDETTAKGSDLVIGSNTFISGFETGLIGHNVGEMVTLDLTFPEDYNADTSLSGKPVQFKVTINSLQEPSKVELNDDFVKENSKTSKTVEEYKEEIRKSLQESYDSQASSYIQYMVQSQAVSNATVKKLPDGMLEDAIKSFKEQIKSAAKSAGVEYKEYISSYYGMSEGTFETQVESYEQSYCEQKLVMEAICKAEKLDLTQGELKEAEEKYVKDNGYESVDALEESYDADTLTEYFQQQKVLKFLEDNATVVPSSQSSN
ncbi:trigger factor [Acetitomaculum ruminis DSM 5522]|uniref:Trigger factor n=1 Tax=Acetitomaculum ruminis DSM 5522 TaxID=1120918 RepID=A0A1I0W6B6_9FIRM|nr:trigger factor [Acetitomaculum ruminis]SFA83830.1 trigger factor [Acetitomaculum ruminis DSM 5522]